MKKTNIIDFGGVEKVLSDVNNIFTSHNLNFEERRLILQFLNDKLLGEQQKISSEKLINVMPFGGIVKGIMNRMNKGEEQ